MSARKLDITKQALNSVREISDYYFLRHEQRFSSALGSSLETIVDFPEIGSSRLGNDLEIENLRTFAM